MLLCLFNRSVVTISVFLGLIAAGSDRTLRLLSGLVPTVIVIMILCVPTLVLTAVSVMRGHELSRTFVQRTHHHALCILSTKVLSLNATCLASGQCRPGSRLCPTGMYCGVTLTFRQATRAQGCRGASGSFAFRTEDARRTSRERMCMVIIKRASQTYG